MADTSSQNSSQARNDPAWMDYCPIQDEDPNEGGLLEQPSMAPGPALQACSGADLFAGKGKSKTKEQYLAILPGQLALHNMQKKINEENIEEAIGGTSNKHLVMGRLIQEDDEGGASSFCLSLPTATMKSNDPAGGEASSTLQMQGKLVRTTSKFLVLQINPKKSTVVCKHVFSKVLVLGDAALVEPGVINKKIVSTGSNVNISQEKPSGNAISGLVATAKAAPPSKAASDNNVKFKCDHVPSQRATAKVAIKREEDVECKPSALNPVKKTKISKDSDDEDDWSAHSTSSSAGGSEIVTVEAPTRRAPRRRRSVAENASKGRYKEEPIDYTDEKSESDEEEDVEPVPKRRKGPTYAAKVVRKPSLTKTGEMEQTHQENSSGVSHQSPDDLKNKSENVESKRRVLTKDSQGNQYDKGQSAIPDRQASEQNLVRPKDDERKKSASRTKDIPTKAKNPETSKPLQTKQEANNLSRSLLVEAAPPSTPTSSSPERKTGGTPKSRRRTTNAQKASLKQRTPIKLDDDEFKFVR